MIPMIQAVTIGRRPDGRHTATLSTVGYLGGQHAGRMLRAVALELPGGLVAALSHQSHMDSGTMQPRTAVAAPPTHAGEGAAAGSTTIPEVE